MYKRPSQNLPLHPRIYPPPLQTYTCDPPRIYPFSEYTPIKHIYMRPSQNLPLPPIIYAHFKHLYATLLESTSTSQIISPFQTYYAILPESTHPSQNIPPFKHI